MPKEDQERRRLRSGAPAESLAGNGAELRLVLTRYA